MRPNRMNKSGRIIRCDHALAGFVSLWNPAIGRLPHDTD